MSQMAGGSVGDLNRPYKRGRAGLQDQLLVRGPPTLVWLVAQPHGRWFAEFARGDGVALRAQSLLTACGVSGQCEVRPSDQLCGIAVIQSWRFLLPGPSHPHSFALMESAVVTHARRGGVQFMEHEVLASARMGHVPDDVLGCKSIGPLSSLSSLGRGVLARCVQAGCMATCTKGVGSGASSLPVSLH